MNLACPDCGKTMVRSRIECHDSSGFMFGWLCDCNDETRANQAQVTIYGESEDADVSKSSEESG